MSRPATKYAFRMPMHTKLDAQAIGDFLDALIDERKEHVTAEEIVAAARKRESPLHDGFTWSDPEAAEKWRRKEAKALVRELFVEKDGKRTRTRALVWVNHPEHDGKRVLLTRDSAMGRPEMRDQLKTRELRRFQRSLVSWGDAVAGNASLRGMVKKLQQRVERELGLVGV